MKDKIQLLSTTSLDQPLVNKALEKGILLDNVSFIQINEIKDVKLTAKVEELCGLPITVVFTSLHAVNALSRFIYITKPDWDIYCIGNSTKRGVLDYFHVSAVKGCADDASALAEIILADGINEVFFFCGDKRMDTLPEILRKRDVVVQEIVVYQTLETPRFIDKEYDGILFFSPSGVNSFFSINEVRADTVLFAIGETTAAAIAQKTTNRVIVCDAPSKEKMVLEAMQYSYEKAATTGIKNG